VDQGLFGPAGAIPLDDAVMRIERAEPLVVSSPWGDGTRQRRITAVAETGRQPGHQVEAIQRI
jgi:hypothetical protein